MARTPDATASSVTGPAADAPVREPLGAFEGITSYQWLVLLIACLGWVFDVFEGQIFVASMRDAMPALLGTTVDDPQVTKWSDWSFASFALGGALGGVVFGVISDRIGRTRTMILTILFYSVFTCVTAFAQAAWQMVVLRFFVAMGVGGEWAVASAMVAEVMPSRSRPVMGSIFHASSVFGSLLAAAAGAYIVGNPALGANAWRWGFALGALPALLTVWVRWQLREPEAWVAARQRTSETAGPPAAGRLADLFAGEHLRNTLVGVGLASIGLVTFWGVHIYGKDALLRQAQQQALVDSGVPATAAQADKVQAYAAHRPAIKRAEMLCMVYNTIGGGLGLVLFGSISNRLGRKGAFIFYHVFAFAMVVLLYQHLIPGNFPPMWMAVALPLFGFFTLGMHAGYAVYFPELYPTRLRGTGAGFCFNMGRVATAVAFVAFGYFPVRADTKAMLLAPLYLGGVVVVLFARETRGEELPE
ncbi:MAG: MFS transporter [Pirellulaceae bacterium]